MKCMTSMASTWGSQPQKTGRLKALGLHVLHDIYLPYRFDSGSAAQRLG